MLIDHFLRASADKNGKSIRGTRRCCATTANVRELENLIERAVVLTRDDVIDLTDLP